MLYKPEKLVAIIGVTLFVGAIPLGISFGESAIAGVKLGNVAVAMIVGLAALLVVQSVILILIKTRRDEARRINLASDHENTAAAAAEIHRRSSDVRIVGRAASQIVFAASDAPVEQAAEEDEAVPPSEKQTEGEGDDSR